MLRGRRAWAVGRKEITDILRDRRTVFMAIIFPLILYPLLIIGIILPKRLVMDKYVALSGAWMAVLSIMAIAFQFFIIRNLPKRLLIISFLVILALTTYLVFRFPKLKTFAEKIVDRLTILTMIYNFFDLIGLIIVIIRNVQGGI